MEERLILDLFFPGIEIIFPVQTQALRLITGVVCITPEKVFQKWLTV